jgi:hypothetical protein
MEKLKTAGWDEKATGICGHARNATQRNATRTNLFVDASEVDGHAELVVLHLGAGDAARRLGQALVHLLYHGQELARRLEQDAAGFGLICCVPGGSSRGLIVGRALDVHAVAAGVVELRQLHELEHLVAAPAAHDRRREVLGDAAHGHPHLGPRGHSQHIRVRGAGGEARSNC